MVVICIRIRMRINSMIMMMILIRRPSSEEGASAFRSCLPMINNGMKRVRERVRGSDRARLNPRLNRKFNSLVPLTTIIIIVRGSDRARLNRKFISGVPLLAALKRRQGRSIVTWGPPGDLLEALKTMNISRIVACWAFWTSRNSQSTPKEPFEGSS